MHAALQGDLLRVQLFAEFSAEGFDPGGVFLAMDQARHLQSGPASWLDEVTARKLKAELAKGPWRRAQDARRWTALASAVASIGVRGPPFPYDWHPSGSMTI